MKQDIKGLEVGSMVVRGQIIGYVGKSGNASGRGSGGAHLHLQIKNTNGEPIDPHDYIYSTYLKLNGSYINNGYPDNNCNQ
jgi:murein DD-endopeptidase MepM/ murein hydrolase activator NlpD